MNWFSKLMGVEEVDDRGLASFQSKLTAENEERERVYAERKKEYEAKLARMKYPKEKVDEETLIVMGAEPSHYLTGVSYPIQVGYACPRCKSNGKEVTVKHIPANATGYKLNTVECPECNLSMWLEYDSNLYYGEFHPDPTMYIAEFWSEEMVEGIHSILKDLEKNEHDLE